VESLETYIEALETGKGSAGDSRLRSRPAAYPSGRDGAANEELDTESACDPEDDADVEQIIAPMKRLVVSGQSSVWFAMCIYIVLDVAS
jgi:hypothetical protein